MTAQTIIDTHGSFITKGPKYSVLQCRGPVRYRQQLASERGVICYCEGHLNAFAAQFDAQGNRKPSPQYGFVVTGKNTPPKTEDWAESYLSKIGATFGIPTKGIVRGVPGQGCVQWVKWPTPTMLLEPLFMTDQEMAKRIMTGEGIDALGRCLADSIVETFPHGGLVGFSIGHAYRGNGDKGANAPLIDDNKDGEPDYEWDESFDQEAELVEAYIDSATEMLVGVRA